MGICQLVTAPATYVVVGHTITHSLCSNIIIIVQGMQAATSCLYTSEGEVIAISMYLNATL